jgi:RNA polymerase sigma factor (sigma-70 family)
VTQALEPLLRELAPSVLSGLIRRYGQFDACEDAVQEALVAASTEWAAAGVPANPKAWLSRVAARRLVDEIRADSARRRREQTAAALAGRPPDRDEGSEADDTLDLLFLCCHPAVAPASQVALTLRAVGGLTTEEIAAAFLLPVATMGPRISRAKAQIRAAGATFAMARPDDAGARLPVVLQVLYLIFNEGYAASSGADLQRPDLAAEAIRLTRLVHARFPDDGEVGGLLALMLLTDARRDTRTGVDGALVPLADQDRGHWHRAAIEEGVGLVTTAMGSAAVGPYQVQAAIAALHAEAPSTEATDWAQIAVLYAILQTMDASPVVVLNRAVAVAMDGGPGEGLALLDSLDGSSPIRRSHRFEATRAHLLELAGSPHAAVLAFRAAAEQAASEPERRYLGGRADALEARDA